MALTAKKVYAILKRQISNMEAKIKTPIIYRGTVATADLLPLNPDIGDMYNIESKSIYGEAGMNVAWNGVNWDTMGAPIDMSLYIKSSELADWVKQQNKPTYTAEEVGALPADTKIPSKTSDLQNDSGFLTKIPDNYLSGTDKTLSVSGKAADAKATGDKIAELSADISNKLNKNQGSENSGKIAGINESGDIVPMFPVSVDYNEETNCLEFGSDQKMELNKGINLDSTLTKTGYAADAGVVGEVTNSLKEDISNKITKFYASSQGETHLADSDNGKIMDMMLYGKSEQKQYSGKNLLNPILETTTQNGVTCTANGDGTYTLNGTATATGIFVLHSNIDFTGQMRLCGGTSLASLQYSNSSNFAYEDKGEGIIIEHFDSVTYPDASFNILIKTGNVYNNALVKPMLTTDLTATYDDFEPYTGGIPSPNPDYPQEIKSVVNPTVKIWTDMGTVGKYLTFEQIETIKDKLNLFYNKKGVLFRKTKYIYHSGTTSPDYTSVYWFYDDENSLKYVRIQPSGVLENAITVGNISDIPESNGDLQIYKGLASYGVYYFSNTEYKTVSLETTLNISNYTKTEVPLPYTLNAIPVSAGGNVTIDGQQYIADYVDVERGKLVRMVDDVEAKNYTWILYPDVNNMPRRFAIDDVIRFDMRTNTRIMSFHFKQIEYNARTDLSVWFQRLYVVITDMNEKWKNSEALIQWFSENNVHFYLPLKTPTEIDLTPEEVRTFKALVTYYPTTNISINSEQLDGYTVFNYPISMENGWNYVKQQIGDTRDYIYDMDARTQDTDLQAAEAYVNSEYAVALTELEV